jgi:hypothetical protein
VTASDCILDKEHSMATSTTDSLLYEPSATPARPELLLSAVLHLMSQYTVGANESGSCLKLAAVIERHLKALIDLPNLAPVLRATCQQAAEQWTAVVERDMPRPEKSVKSALLARFVAGPAPAESGGKQYEVTRNHLTYSFVRQDGMASGPAAPSKHNLD